jgi:hypothetical protein
MISLNNLPEKFLSSIAGKRVFVRFESESENQTGYKFVPKFFYSGTITEYIVGDAQAIVQTDPENTFGEHIYIPVANIFAPQFSKGDRIGAVFPPNGDNPPQVEINKLATGIVAKDFNYDDTQVVMNFDMNVGGWGDSTLDISDGYGWFVKIAYIDYVDPNVKIIAKAQSKGTHLRPFDRSIDGVGTRIGVYGAKISASEIAYKQNPDKMFFGKVVRLDEDLISPVEFEDDIENTIVPVDRVRHGAYISENDMFVEEEGDETQVPIFSQKEAKEFISKTINEILFEKDVNRIKVLEASIQEKFGKDWKEALVAQDILDANAADLFAQILEGLKNEEDARLGVSRKTESKPIEAEKPKRGRKKKEPVQETPVVIEPEIEIEEPENNIDLGEIDDLLSDEDLGDLLEGIEDIDF